MMGMPSPWMYATTWHAIEGQDWEHAAQDRDIAMVLFQMLLENLDIQYSRFVQQEESFLLHYNICRFKHNFQRYQEVPYALASIIPWFLRKEKRRRSCIALSRSNCYRSSRTPWRQTASGTLSAR